MDLIEHDARLLGRQLVKSQLPGPLVGMFTSKKQHLKSGRSQPLLVGLDLVSNSGPTQMTSWHHRLLPGPLYAGLWS